MPAPLHPFYWYNPLFAHCASFQTASSDNTLWPRWKSQNQRSLSLPPEARPSNLEFHPLCTPLLFRSSDHSSRGTKMRPSRSCGKPWGLLHMIPTKLGKIEMDIYPFNHTLCPCKHGANHAEILRTAQGSRAHILETPSQLFSHR